MTILSNGGPQGRFTLSDGLAMWIDATRSGVFVSSANGSTTTMQSSDNKIADAVGLDSDLIAAVSPSVYAYPTVFSFGIGVVRVNPSGEPVQLSGECFYPLDLAAGGGRVFWTCEDNTFHWTSQAGGDADHVITDVLSSTIAVNGRGDAFLADAMEGRVMRLRAGATSMDVVMQGLTRPTAIAADEGAVYVADASGLRIVALP